MKENWQHKDTAPKTGQWFFAWDDLRNELLTTMHWDGEEFLTEYEQWSGHWTYWMPKLKGPYRGHPND